MKQRRIFQAAVVVLSTLIMAVSATTASATSYAGSWGSIFGNSTSCSFVRASINDTSHRAGGVVKNVWGCSSPGNALRAVPRSYLGLRVRMFSSDGYLCAQSPTRFNQSTTASLTVTTAWSFSARCNTGARYYSQAEGQRQKASSGAYFARTAVSPARYFAWSRAASEPAYERTAAGLTTGEVAAALPEDKRPTLTPRTGENGRPGYIRVADVFGESIPRSEEEAAKQAGDAGIVTEDDGDIYAPVYAGDGTTVIDRLLIATVGAVD